MKTLSWIEKLSHLVFVRVWSLRLKHDPALAQALERHVRQSAEAPPLVSDSAHIHLDTQTPAVPKSADMSTPQILRFPAKHALGDGELFEQPAQYCVTRSKKQLGLVELKN